MPSSNPKDQTAYQRWEIGSLNKDPTLQQDALTATSKLAQELLIARDEGYQKGLEEGRATGITEGLEIGTAKGHAEALAEGQAQNLLINQQFGTLINAFEIELQDAKEQTAQQLLELCLDMTQAMLKAALTVHPDLLLPIIHQALQELPSVQLPATLYLNATDLAWVQLAIGDDLKKDGWRLISDKHIEAGGCRLETTTNQIDLTLPTRWQQLLNALGKNGEWLTHS